MVLRNEYFFKYFCHYHALCVVAEYTEVNESSSLVIAPYNFAITHLTFLFLGMMTRTTDHLPATGVITGKATESCGINKGN